MHLVEGFCKENLGERWRVLSDNNVYVCSRKRILQLKIM